MIQWEEGIITANIRPAQWEEGARPSCGAGPMGGENRCLICQTVSVGGRLRSVVWRSPQWEEEALRRWSRPQWEEGGRCLARKSGLCEGAGASKGGSDAARVPGCPVGGRDPVLLCACQTSLP